MLYILHHKLVMLIRSEIIVSYRAGIAATAAAAHCTSLRLLFLNQGCIKHCSILNLCIGSGLSIAIIKSRLSQEVSIGKNQCGPKHFPSMLLKSSLNDNN